MIVKNDNLIEHLVNDFTISKFDEFSLLRKGFNFGDKINDRFLVYFCSLDQQVIHSAIEYIYKTQNSSIIKRNYIIFVIKEFHDSSDTISLKDICKKAITPHLFLIDATKCLLNKDIVTEYCYNMHVYENLLKENKLDADIYKTNAQKAMLGWIEDVNNNEVVYYDMDNIDGMICQNFSKVANLLYEVNEKKYPEFPEKLNLPSELANIYNIDKYASYGISLKEDIFEEDITSDKKPSKIFASIWNESGTLTSDIDNSYISKLKKYVDSYIEDKIKKEGRVSGVDLIVYLNKHPYGFVSSKLSAYILGIILRSYIGKEYYYTDGDIYDKLDAVYLESFIINALKKTSTYMPSLKDMYICVADKKIQKFIDLTKNVFDISDEIFSIERLKYCLREKIEKLKYPLWCLKYIDIKSDVKIIMDIYLNLINPKYVDEVKNRNIEDNIYVNNILEKIGQNASLIDDCKACIDDNLLEKGMSILLMDKKERFDTYINGSVLTNEWKWIWREERFIDDMKNLS